jgi:hypothetical protein
VLDSGEFFCVFVEGEGKGKKTHVIAWWDFSSEMVTYERHFLGWMVRLGRR